MQTAPPQQPPGRDGQWRARRFIALVAAAGLLLHLGMAIVGWLEITSDQSHWLLEGIRLVWPLVFILSAVAVGAWVRREGTPIALFAFGVKAVAVGLYILMGLLFATHAAQPLVDMVADLIGPLDSVASIIILLLVARSGRHRGPGPARTWTWALAITGSLWIGVQLGFSLAGEPSVGGTLGAAADDLVWLVLMLSLWTMPSSEQLQTATWPTVLKGAARFRSAVVLHIVLALLSGLLLVVALMVESAGLAKGVFAIGTVGDVVLTGVASWGLWSYAAVDDDSRADQWARSAWAASALLLIMVLTNAVVLISLALGDDLRTLAGVAQEPPAAQTLSMTLLRLVALGGFLLSVARLGSWLADSSLRRAALHTAFALVVVITVAAIGTVGSEAPVGMNLLLLAAALWLVVTLLVTTKALMQTAKSQALADVFGSDHRGSDR